MDDDCFAARLAAALRQRCGDRAGPLARRRLIRATAQADTIKTDLYLAVTVILQDETGLFRRSRAAASVRPPRA